MISPIGSAILRLDTLLTGTVDIGVLAVASYASAPLLLAASSYYTLQGIKLANADPEPLHNFIPNLLRIGFVLFFALNMDGLNYYVRGVLMTGFPAAIGGALATGTGSSGNDLNATAALLDGLYADTWVCISACWALSGFSLTGLAAVITGLLAAGCGGVAMAFVGLVVISSRFSLGILTILAPVLIGCGIYAYTRQYLDRAIGLVVSLIILIAASVIATNIMVLGSQWFLARATESIITASTDAAAGYETIQILMTLVIWFGIAGWMILQLKHLAYSIGGGQPTSGPSLYALSLLMRNGQSSGRGGGTPSGPGPNYQASLPSQPAPQLSGGSAPPSIAAPPPPSLTHSTRR